MHTSSWGEKDYKATSFCRLEFGRLSEHGWDTISSTVVINSYILYIEQVGLKPINISNLISVEVPYME